MNVILLLVPVILSTAIWPINRQVMQNGGRGDAYGFWISSAAAVSGGLLAAIFHQTLAVGSLWIVGGIVGLAFSLGFCIIVNYCLKIGPTGPTVAANNMGLIGPVVVGLLWPVRQPLSAPVAVGIVLVVLAIVGFSFSASGEKSKTVTARWAVLAVLGWVFSSMSMTGQYMGGVLNPKLPLAQVTAFSVVATVILLPFMIRRGKTWFKKVELLGGILNGVIQAVSLFMTLQALQRMPARVVFPITVLTPLILVLMLSGLVYRERLSRLVWIACGVGVVGLALLAIFQ
jgi:hypothetical protein